MTPDELVAAIFAEQMKRNPNADPGDLTISVQDDMPMAQVQQYRALNDNEPFVPQIVKNQGVIAPTIQKALETYLQEVKDGIR